MLVAVKMDADAVELQVIDNGPGLPKKGRASLTTLTLPIAVKARARACYRQKNHGRPCGELILGSMNDDDAPPVRAITVPASRYVLTPKLGRG